ncbi:hypothetical protein [Methylobacterium nodulans]|uniref:Uncharacterized protein n=1 Tax=Methylobacterium nodulans (strain LMG 21967 / CNCM I-2342 / ORS 2060) TaxID=460265 RepID=B8IXG8_METNO|nr:hypothetical protein [Methylobacterium nodulans]ACL63209.1 hypothetical protein Mnod_8239 [Methylobacterium nodulans ORS 2060]
MRYRWPHTLRGWKTLFWLWLGRCPIHHTRLSVEAARQGQLTVAEHKKLVAATEAAFAALRTEHQEVLCDLGDRVDEIVRLREALKPFVEYARYALIAGMEGEIGEVIVVGFRRSISTQALRRTVEAYGEPPETSDAR